jgi:hypothetical protein
VARSVFVSFLLVIFRFGADDGARAIGATDDAAAVERKWVTKLVNAGSLSAAANRVLSKATP